MPFIISPLQSAFFSPLHSLFNPSSPFSIPIPYPSPIQSIYLFLLHSHSHLSIQFISLYLIPYPIHSFHLYPPHTLSNSIQFISLTHSSSHPPIQSFFLYPIRFSTHPLHISLIHSPSIPFLKHSLFFLLDFYSHHRSPTRTNTIYPLLGPFNEIPNSSSAPLAIFLASRTDTHVSLLLILTV